MAVQQGQRRLSDQVQRSWESGDFWVSYALLHSFAFDSIYWQKFDQRFFGPTETDDPIPARPGKSGWTCWMKPKKVTWNGW